ncbi:MAG: hypothetical protein ABGZ35_30750 [Planctomycetaceae bacterium]|jgi:hypothetical protein
MGRRRSNQPARAVRRSRQPAHRGRITARPPSAHKRRGTGRASGPRFDAPEIWHEPRGDGDLQMIVQQPGAGYFHPITAEEVQDRIANLPVEFCEGLEYVHFSRMTRKRRLFPCYGLQWGTAVYLYPVECELEELYLRAPSPRQRIEAEMFGGRWIEDGLQWWLVWTESTIRDYYLNNVLIHEIGHINDCRNTRFADRERFADWFAIEFGYRASRSRLA